MRTPMPEHVAEQHDTIPSIADAFGLSRWQAVWNHPRNAELRRTRTPTLLLPGDVVFVPEPRGADANKEVTRPAGQHHRFVVSRRPLMLRLRLVNLLGDDLAGAAVQLDVEGTGHDLTADGGGVVSCVIPPRTRAATVVTRDRTVPLAVGALDPVDHPSGLYARLRALGFDPGDPQDGDDMTLQWAIEEFQLSFGLRPDGKSSSAQTQLVQLFGC
jgi:N-acetylmuramoyl-L-alanine amidase